MKNQLFVLAALVGFSQSLRIDRHHHESDIDVDAGDMNFNQNLLNQIREEDKVEKAKELKKKQQSYAGASEEDE